MNPRRLFLKSATAIAAVAFATPTVVWADEPLPVVATFSILGDMVAEIGGDHISVTTLVGPNGDPHVYQPTPQAARAVAEAEVLVTNGLEFEGWLERLVEAAAFDGSMVVATTGIDPIEFGEHEDDHDDHLDHGEEHAVDEHGHDHDKDHDDDHGDHAADEHDHEEDDHHDHAEHDHDKEHDDDHGHDDHAGHDHGAFDPHAWQSIDAAITYVDNIAAGLSAADPENAGAYYENRAAYVAELETLGAEISAMLATILESKRTIVTSHDAFQYFGRDYDLTFLAPQGLSTESEASAKDVAELIEQIREDEISAVFVENIADTRLLEQVANETDAVIGGTLYPGALSGEDGPAPTYLDMMRHNASTLAAALGSGS